MQYSVQFSHMSHIFSPSRSFVYCRQRNEKLFNFCQLLHRKTLRLLIFSIHEMLFINSVNFFYRNVFVHLSWRRYIFNNRSNLMYEVSECVSIWAGSSLEIFRKMFHIQCVSFGWKFRFLWVSVRKKIHFPCVSDI